jgi:hypothetical protein
MRALAAIAILGYSLLIPASCKAPSSVDRKAPVPGSSKPLTALVQELLPSSSPALPGELARVEERLGSRLQSQHRALLGIANGGAPRRACYRNGGNSIYLQYIWGIEAPSGPGEEDLEGLERRIRNWKAPAGPEQLVPIARGGKDDQIAISLKDGSIHYLKETDEFRAPAELARRIEPSLTDFLRKLKDEF